MPKGTPIFVKSDGGVLVPQYVGQLRGTASIDSWAREEGQVFVPEFYPDYLTYHAPDYNLPNRPLRPVAGIWAEHPSPVAANPGPWQTERLYCRVTKGTSGPTAQKLLLDVTGVSDFCTPYSGTSAYLGINAASTFADAATTSVDTQAIGVWNYVPDITAYYTVGFAISGYTGAVGLMWCKLLINGGIVAWSRFYANEINSHKQFPMIFYDAGLWTKGVAVQLMIHNYNMITDNSGDRWSMIVMRRA